MDSVFRGLWLATQSVNILHYSLIHLQFLRVSDAKLAKVVSKMLSRFAAVNKQRNFTTNQASCFRNTRRRWRSSDWKFEQVKLRLFDTNLSIKPVKKFFVYKCKLSLSLALLYLVELFINKLKTKLNNLFFIKEFTTPFEEISPQELNQCLQKF